MKAARRRLTADLLAQSEAAFERGVIDYAVLKGWRGMHFSQSQRCYMVGQVEAAWNDRHKGWPDWILWRERVIFVELKTVKGRLSKRQQQVIDSLRAAGQECYVWRPTDWDEIERVLA